MHAQINERNKDLMTHIESWPLSIGDDCYFNSYCIVFIVEIHEWFGEYFQPDMIRNSIYK